MKAKRNMRNASSKLRRLIRNQKSRIKDNAVNGNSDIRRRAEAEIAVQRKAYRTQLRAFYNTRRAAHLSYKKNKCN
jgi:hypothetical protein